MIHKKHTQSTKNKTPNTQRARIVRRVVIGLAAILGVLVTLGVAAYLFFLLSPWPSALMIRHQFEKGGDATNAILEKYVPGGVAVTKDLKYADNDKDAYLDVYYPAGTDEPLATIVWVHGGGWIAGNKEGLEPWARILAGKGFTVVAVNYSIAPEKHYPLPVIQTNQALGYITEHADKLHIDPHKLVLAGDSAGSHIVSQIALLTESSTYADNIDIQPTLKKGQIAAMLLNCGPYDLNLVNTKSDSDGAKLVRTFLWAYTGKKDFMDDPRMKYASIPEFITEDFPPSFITAGSVDPLLPHSEELAEALQEKGVEADTLFYPKDYTPALNHEYQFNLDTKEGQVALDRMVEFARKKTDYL